MPNPNVMTELGYALKAIGEKRVLLVMNEAFGAADSLPFDLKSRRWPIRYELSAVGSSKKEVFKKLQSDIQEAIKVILNTTTVFNYNIETRRKYLTIFQDPDHEVKDIDSWKAERNFINDRTPRGVYELVQMKGITSVVTSAVEADLLTKLITQYLQYRRSCDALDIYCLRFVPTQLPGNTFTPYWRVVSCYCTLIAAGFPRAEAKLFSSTQNISHDGKDCERIEAMLSKDSQFQSLSQQARINRDEIRRLVDLLRHEIKSSALLARCSSEEFMLTTD